MKKDRRLFLGQVSVMMAAAALGKPLASAGAATKRINTLCAAGHDVTIFHTNDLRGNIGPAFDNLGGLDQIDALLKRQETFGLLIDGGNFLNGWHSISRQKQVIGMMNRMRYHAATIGDHELSQGQDALAALVPLMQFSLVNCNYEFDNALNKLIKPYIIINSGRFRIGITGVGQQLNNVKYNDAIQSANNTAHLLKQNNNCDLVICLSHLGYSEAGNKPDNLKLAKHSAHIDMIVCGHNRTLLNGNSVALNKLKQEVIIGHSAWDGLMMGKTVFSFDTGKQKSNIRTKQLIPGQLNGQTFAASFTRLQSLQN